MCQLLMDILSFALNLEFSEHHIDAFQSSVFPEPHPVYNNLLFRHVRRAVYDLRTCT